MRTRMSFRFGVMIGCYALAACTGTQQRAEYHSVALAEWQTHYAHASPKLPVFVLGFEKVRAEETVRHGLLDDRKWPCVEGAAGQSFCLDLKRASVVEPADGAPTKWQKKLPGNIREFIVDPRVQWLTHIARVDKSTTCLLYRTSAEQTVESCNGADSSFQPRSVAGAGAAFDLLVRSVQQEISEREAAGAPVTHLLVLATGWNTVQDESLKNFIDWTNNLYEQSQHAFRPIVIGISWQSTWGRQDTPLGGPLGMGSFANKSNDADELGFTWANQLVNRYMLPVAADRQLPVLLIGHSFGTRVIAGAVRGRNLLLDLPALPAMPRVDFVAMQPAFSANRLIREHREPLYTLAPIPGSRSIYTASDRDLATAKGNILFGIFGKKPYVSSPQVVKALQLDERDPYYRDNFERWQATCIAPGSDQKAAPCSANTRVRLTPPPDDKCHLTPIIDASDVVKDPPQQGSGRSGAHSDVFDEPAAQLILQASVACRPESTSASERR